MSRERSVSQMGRYCDLCDKKLGVNEGEGINDKWTDVDTCGECWDSTLASTVEDSVVKMICRLAKRISSLEKRN